MKPTRSPYLLLVPLVRLAANPLGDTTDAHLLEETVWVRSQSDWTPTQPPAERKPLTLQRLMELRAMLDGEPEGEDVRDPADYWKAKTRDPGPTDMGLPWIMERMAAARAILRDSGREEMRFMGFKIVSRRPRMYGNP